MRGFTNSRLIHKASQSLFGGSGRYVLGWVTSGIALFCALWLLVPSATVRQLYEEHSELHVTTLSGVGAFIVFLIASLIITVRRSGGFAVHDALTLLPNRLWVKQNLPSILDQATAAQSSVAVLYINFDSFKHVNDLYGHSVGDKLLEAAARRLVHRLPSTAIAVRIGGDEFLIIQQNAVLDDTDELASKLLETFAEPFLLGRHSVQSGASIGISVFPHDAGTADDLLKNASVALYSAKARKGAASYFDASKYDQWCQQLSIEAELANAITQDQFVIHYQPRAVASSGEICGFEALIRWQHPSMGLVYPNDFIPVAEKTELIVLLGTLVIEKVCAQQAQWYDQGFDLVPVSVNVSAKQFNRGIASSTIVDALRRYDLAPQHLDVELTESAVIDTHKTALNEFSYLKQLGIKLHVDDFGTGHSSLALLQELNLDVLKIDRAFVSRLTDSPDGVIFINAIISMAHALGMSVIAEGVETKEQWLILKQLDCDEVQGYYLSKPKPPDQLTQFLNKRNYN